MELKQLEYFLACARHSSLTLAAEELKTTQPHVSMMIKSLERELGIKLFKRRSKGVEMTQEGERIYNYAVNTLKNAHFIASVSKENSNRIIRAASIPSEQIDELFVDYYKEIPDLHLQHVQCSTEEMLGFISDGTCDLGFLFVPEAMKDMFFKLLKRRHLEFIALLETELVVYIGKNHPMIEKDSIGAEELEELIFVQVEDDFFSIEELIKKGPGTRGIKQMIKTGSSHMLTCMLQETSLCNLGYGWDAKSFSQKGIKKLRINGSDQKVLFGYVKYEETIMEDPVLQLLKFFMHSIQTK